MRNSVCRRIAFFLAVTLLTAAAAVFPAQGAASLTVDKYVSGSIHGAESWPQQSEGHTLLHTQFLLTLSNEDWTKITDGLGITVTETHYDSAAGQWVQGGVRGGRFELEITDLDGIQRTVVCPPTTTAGIGSGRILRFETADHGDPAYQMEYGNRYSIRLRVFQGERSEPAYVSNRVEDLYWTPGDAGSGCDKMYVNGKALEPTPRYIPGNDPYKTPVTTRFYHSEYAKDSDFEAHDVFGKNLLFGIPLSSVPEDAETCAARLKAARVTVEIGGEVTTASVSDCFGERDGYENGVSAGVPCLFVRAAMESFPAAGLYRDCVIRILRETDGSCLFEGKMDLYSTGDILDITGELGTYGTGAETWEDHAGAPDYTAGSGQYVTQFLITVPQNIHTWLTQMLSYTPSGKENGKFIPAKWEGGRFELSILDGSETTVLTLAPASQTGYGDRVIYRFETCEAGLQIKRKTVYDITLRVYAGETQVCWGRVYGLTWSDDHGRGIYQAGRLVEDGVSDFYHGSYVPGGYDFEDHDSLGKNLLIGIPYAKLPNAEELLHEGQSVTAVIGGETYETKIASIIGRANGVEDGKGTDVACYFIRIRFPVFPKAGEYQNCTLTVRSSGGTVLYSGVTDLRSQGDDLTEAQRAWLTPQSGDGGSDWIETDGTFWLCVVLHGVSDPQDLKYFNTSVEVELDGQRKQEVSFRVTDLPRTQEEQTAGIYSELLTLDVGTPAAGAHTVKLTVYNAGEISYLTEAITVYFRSGSALLGDADGNGRVNNADRTYLARATAGFDGYFVPPERGDVNRDGRVNNADRTWLARALAGWDGYSI